VRLRGRTALGTAVENARVLLREHPAPSAHRRYRHHDRHA
jgi:hypothetical protein